MTVVEERVMQAADGVAVLHSREAPPSVEHAALFVLVALSDWGAKIKYVLPNLGLEESTPCQG